MKYYSSNIFLYPVTETSIFCIHSLLLVCIKVIQDIRDMLDKEDWSKKPMVEEAMAKYCANKELPPREKKVCYYIDPIKRDVAQPFSTGMPVDKVCKRINQKNAEVCGVKFPIKSAAMPKEDIAKLRVKALKKILADRGVECKNCVEKSEYVNRVIETAHLDGEL
uniref:Mesencephalic astrocyte-derived neurotrophic factor homolog n=1 Tax=Corethron hystrix TaxID=216773 RepID=A0A7S1FUV6_9STRA|mmetsp:Transcript_32917/g.75783  ORF Transcript_32917/g.75783 Transcript_32917/m.75783 type:complete len:165 (+) Transcript_32917:809-1303(+)